MICRPSFWMISMAGFFGGTILSILTVMLHTDLIDFRIAETFIPVDNQPDAKKETDNLQSEIIDLEAKLKQTKISLRKTQEKLLRTKEENEQYRQKQNDLIIKRTKIKDKKMMLNPDARYYQTKPLDIYQMPKNLPPLSTAYDDATVVHKAPWFDKSSLKKKEKICKETCCVESIAISLDQDDRRPITTVDGADLADIRMRANGSSNYLTFFASDLTDDIIPCLQPGTIINVDGYTGTLNHFLDKFYSKIQVPFVLVATDTDEVAPQEPIFERLFINGTDDKIIKWYVINPRELKKHEEPFKDKWAPMHLGLSKNHQQVPYLKHYLEQTNYSNPFRNKTYWLTHKELWSNDTDVLTNLIFAKFNIGRHSPHREKPYNMTCVRGRLSKKKNKKIEPMDDVSCSLGKGGQITPGEIYAAASRYPFGMSPRGAGNDCYRTYELLFLGVIPIVQEHGFPGEGMYEMPYFKNLPRIQLHHNYEYTPKQVIKKLRDYVKSDEFLNNDFEAGWNQLFLRHWRRIILKETKRDVEIMNDYDGNEYYQAYRYTSYREPQVFQ